MLAIVTAVARAVKGVANQADMKSPFHEFEPGPFPLPLGSGFAAKTLPDELHQRLPARLVGVFVVGERYVVLLAEYVRLIAAQASP